jgi:hypothetical protein
MILIYHPLPHLLPLIKINTIKTTGSAGRVARMGKMRNAQNILVDKTEG